MEVLISTSKNSSDKYDARIDGTKTISFGEKGASDFTKHKEPQRKDRYIDRHKASEYWTKSGAKAVGFYSKHVFLE